MGLSNNPTCRKCGTREESSFQVLCQCEALTSLRYTWFVQKVSGLTTAHEVDKAYRVLTLTVFNMVPLRSYTIRPTFLPLLETFCKLLFRDV